ncbi:MAG: DoxX family protein [Emcibacteraceae bacterium]|nr:DoxX family protein [Emcibacteraceae bacterium]
MNIKSINNAVWAKFSEIPDWAMSLLARLSVAGIFWRSGQTKVVGWEISDFTFMLFETEYALPLIPFKTATYMATFAEHFFPLLLVIGLATRLSAGALLIMTLVIQLFVYPASWPDHAIWAVAMLFIMSRGPGGLSIDYFIKTKICDCK